MTDRDDINIGEIGRSVARIELTLREARDRHHEQNTATNLLIGKLSEKIDRYIGPVAVLEQKAADARKDIETLELEMKEISKKAAQVSILGAIGAMVAGLLPWPWKRA